uniref:DOMON domain-containing protein n=1 Tax=Parascaris univalens TaxID=6257 RepID=A0A915C0D9_PARUN
PMMFAFIVMSLLCIKEAQLARSGCSYRFGGYKLEWYLDGMQTVHFQLILSNIPFGAIGWTGVGFGNSMSTGLDVITVRVVGSHVSVNDESVVGYRRPWSDANQNVRMESASFNNGALRLHFSRPLRTNDAFADRNLSGCQPWQFPPTLSRMDPDGLIHVHADTPRMKVICIERCLL